MLPSRGGRTHQVRAPSRSACPLGSVKTAMPRAGHSRTGARRTGSRFRRRAISVPDLRVVTGGPIGARPRSWRSPGAVSRVPGVPRGDGCTRPDESGRSPRPCPQDRAVPAGTQNATGAVRGECNVGRPSARCSRIPGVPSRPTPAPGPTRLQVLRGFRRWGSLLVRYGAGAVEPTSTTPARHQPAPCWCLFADSRGARSGHAGARMRSKPAQRTDGRSSGPGHRRPP